MLTTSKGVIVTATATPLTMPPASTAAQLPSPNHCGKRRPSAKPGISGAGSGACRMLTGAGYWCRILLDTGAVSLDTHLVLADPVLGRGEGGELRGRAHGHARHGARHPPPQPRHAVLPVDALEGTRDALGRGKIWGERERGWPQTPLAFTHKATAGTMRVALGLVSLHPANIT